MCGRFTSVTPAGDLAVYFGADVGADERGPRYNVAPTDEIYAVAESDGRRRLGSLRWGLVPWWADSPKVGSRMINARAETLLDKPAFRRAAARRRCLLPADGYYEWTRRPDGAKQAWYARRRDGDVLAFAGLWDSWRPRSGSDDGRLVSAAIVTTVANGTVGTVHERMPVCLAPTAWDAWLDPANDEVDDLLALLVPAPSELFEVVAVGSAVGNVANDGPGLLTPV